MARRTQSKSDELLAKTISTRYIAAADARTDRETRWEEARKRFDPQYIDRDKVDRGPFVKGGYVFRNVRTKLSHLLSASEANGRWVNVRSTTREGGAVGDVVTMALESQFRRSTSDISNNNEDALERYGQNGLLYGDSYAHISWYEDDEEWGCRIRNVDPFDVFPDWKANRWFIVRRWVTVAELFDLASELSAPSGEQVGEDEETGEPIFNEEPRDGGRAIKAVKKIERDIRQGKRGPNNDRDTYATHSNQRQNTIGRVSDFDDGDDDYESASEDPYNARVLILEYFETRRDGIVARVVPGYGNDDAGDLLIQKEKNPYRVCPIVPFTPIAVDNEVWGYGESEVVGALSEAIDANLRFMLRSIAKYGDAPLLVQRGLRLKREVLANPSGMTIPVPDPTNAMAYLSPNHDPTLPALGQSVAKQAADLITGESEIRRGAVGGADSATEAAIAESSGQTNDRLIYRRWARSIEQIGRVMLAIMKVRVTEEQIIPILGRDSDTFMKLRPEHLKGSFEVTFGGSSRGMNPRQEIAERYTFVQTFAPFGVVDVPAMARSALTKMGEKNPDQYLTVKAQRPKMKATSENYGMIQLAQQFEVHPEDDDFQHMQAHAKAFRTLQAENPYHPALEELADHYQAHIAAAQQKQGQMAMGGPAPGPQQPQPGPGQMLAQGDRAANVEQDKQMPNEQAAGAAPGGVVPGRQVGQIVNGGML